MIYDVSSPLFRSFLNHNRSASSSSGGTLALSLPSCALPGDVIINIVSQLPVISIMRFQLVHKSWRALFCDPTFVGKHVNQTWMTSTEHFIHKKEGWESTESSLHSAAILNDQCKKTLFKKLSGNFETEGCCCGLICLRNLKPENGAADLYFWNPAIRKVKLLPNYVRSQEHRLAFGFVPSLNDYKVVKMDYKNFDNTLRMAPDVEVFSFRSNCWRRVGYGVPGVTFNGQWAYVNEVVHWKAMTTLVAFNMVYETFQLIHLPHYFDPRCMKFIPKRLGGSLSVVIDDANYWYVWVMKEYGVATSWSKQCKVRRWPHVSIFPYDFTRKGELLCLGRDRCKSSQLLLRNLNNQRDTIVDLGGDFTSWRPYICAENLILLDGGDDIAEHSDLLGGDDIAEHSGLLGGFCRNFLSSLAYLYKHEYPLLSKCFWLILTVQILGLVLRLLAGTPGKGDEL